MSLTDVSTYRQAVDAFIGKADWLTDVDLPGVMVLRSLADTLDAEAGVPKAALLAQFTMTFRDLRGRAPKEPTSTGDPLAAALADAQQPDLFTAAALAYEDGATDGAH